MRCDAMRCDAMRCDANRCIFGPIQWQSCPVVALPDAGSDPECRQKRNACGQGPDMIGGGQAPGRRVAGPTEGGLQHRSLMRKTWHVSGGCH